MIPKNDTIQPYSEHDVKIWKKLETTFFKLNFIWDKAKKVQSIEHFKTVDFCVHSNCQIIPRQNITSACSQEAPAVVKW